MVCAGINDAQGMAAGREVEGNRLDLRMVLIKEIDGHQIAHSGSSLVHQAAGLAEEHILRVLADLGNLCLGDLGTEEQVVDDGTNQHLISRGRRKAGAGQDGGFAVSIKALDCTTKLGKSCCHTADQRRGGIDFLFLGGQLRHIDLTEGISLGENTDHAGAVFTDSRHRIQIHRRSQDTATLMVRVVAADLGTAGCRKIPGGFAAKGGCKAGIQGIFL